MKYTSEDLKIMQSFPLERKIQITQTRIIEWYEHYNGKVYVSFSGGKDSTVLLDLTRRIYPDVPAVFVDTGLEYPEIREFVKTKESVIWLRPKTPFNKVIEEHGWVIPSKDVASMVNYARKGSNWAIKKSQGLNDDGSYSAFRQRYKKWAFLIDAPFKISEKCCKIMKEEPLNRYTKETFNKPIVGIMAQESMRRTHAWLDTGCNVFDGGKPMSKPMSFWTEQDVLEYIKTFNISYCSVYGTIVETNNGLQLNGEKRTGCMFCPIAVHREKSPNRFERMKLTHPKQYDYCINKLGLKEVLDYLGVRY